jgi:hypothetical protein
MEPIKEDRSGSTHVDNLFLTKTRRQSLERSECFLQMEPEQLYILTQK